MKMLVALYFSDRADHRLLNDKLMNTVELYTFKKDNWVYHSLRRKGYFYRIEPGMGDTIEKRHRNHRGIILQVHTREFIRPNWIMGATCNEWARLISGVDIGFTLNPHHLFKKLIKFDERRNYTILKVS